MTGRFDPTQYEPVEDRIRRFWADHQNGRILTDLVHRDEKQYVVRAEVYTDRDDPRPSASGYAEEVIGSSPVNRTNALENAETSAIGRALANLNYAPKGARPSQEEMEKANRTPARDIASATKKTDAAKKAEDGKWAAKMVDTLLVVDTVDRAVKGQGVITADARKGLEVSGLLSRDDKEVLDIKAGEPITLEGLAALVVDYVERHKRPVRADHKAAA